MHFIPRAVAPTQQMSAPHRLYHAENTTYDAKTRTVTIYAHRIPHGKVVDASTLNKVGSERTLDTASLDGIENYGTAAFAWQPVNRVRLIDRYVPAYARVHHYGTYHSYVPSTQHTGASTTQTVADIPATSATSGTAGTSTSSTSPSSSTTTPATPGTSSPSSPIQIPPPGVRIDPNITPIASISATPSAKFAAIVQVAQSKLGTPYIWGHNEDRGQYGFDCSNFTEYVYHHALGYLMTTSSKGQYLNVGDPVSVSQMQPGDLVAFDLGAHVGIYTGNGQMIQEGGGLKKVGYLPLAPGKYWYNHISAVKRLY